MNTIFLSRTKEVLHLFRIQFYKLNRVITLVLVSELRIIALVVNSTRLNRFACQSEFVTELLSPDSLGYFASKSFKVSKLSRPILPERWHQEIEKISTSKRLQLLLVLTKKFRIPKHFL